MFLTDARLKQVVAIANYINQCPECCLKTLVQSELDDGCLNQPIEPEGLRSDILTLRWLKITQKLSSNLTMSTLCISQYIRTRLRIEPLIYKYAEEHRHLLNNLIPLEHEVLKKQDEIFANLLYLTMHKQIKKIGLVKSTISVSDIINDAVALYKKHMYQEAIYEFETICIIERYDYLQIKKTQNDQDILNGFMTTNFSIIPEMAFLEAKLNTHNLIDFKMEGVQEFVYSLDSLSDLTSGRLSQQLSDAMSTVKDLNIDRDLLVTNPGKNNIKVRETSLYLNPKKLTTIYNHMEQEVSRTEQFEDEIRQKIAQTEMPEQFEIVQSELTPLRDIIKKYKHDLIQIEEIERLQYKQRSGVHLANRRQALNTLETATNRTNELTVGLRHLVGVLIDEIKANKPHWSELSLLDKILDIITLGIHALVRLSTFNEHKSSIELHQTIDPSLKGHHAIVQ